VSFFTPIISGAEPSEKILEDAKHLAILEKKPLKRGHVVVLPKREIDFIFDLSDEEFRDLMSFARRVGRMIQHAIKCEKVALAVLGLQVRHAHIHLVPVDHASELDFARERLAFSADEFASTAQEIRASPGS